MPPSFLAVRLNAETYPVEPEERAELERAEAEFVALEGETEAEIVRAAQDCDALLVVSAKIPASVVASPAQSTIHSRSKRYRSYPMRVKRPIQACGALSVEFLPAM